MNNIENMDNMDNMNMDNKNMDNMDNKNMDNIGNKNKHISFAYIYIDSNNEIIHIIDEPLFLKTENKVSKNELVDMIKLHSIYDDTRYTVLSILKYNVHNLPEEQDSSFLSIITHIDDIFFQDTLPHLQELNEILILFYEKTNMANINTNLVPSFSQTKRVYIRNNRRTRNRRNLDTDS